MRLNSNIVALIGGEEILAIPGAAPPRPATAGSGSPEENGACSIVNDRGRMSRMISPSPNSLSKLHTLR